MGAQAALQSRVAEKGIFCLAGVALLLWFVSPGALAQNPTTTTVVCSPDPIVFGQSATCTAIVTDTGASPTTPTGTVTFVGPGSFSPNPCTLAGSGGTAVCNTTYTPGSVGTGTHTITATYSGDANHSSSSGTYDLTVNKADTTTTITSDTPDPSVVNQSYIVSITVTVNPPGSGTPTGTVTVDDGDGNSCTILLSGGSGSCGLTSTSQGPKTLTATYGGDPNFNGSSDTESHQVNPRQTSTTLSCTFDFAPNYVRAGNTVICMATVTDVDPYGPRSAPSGTVSFASSGSGTFSPGPSCTLTATGSDSSQCSVDYTPATGSDGTHIITANYGGSSVHDTSSDSTGLAVDGTPPTITPTIGSPKYPAGCNPPSICFVTSATDINVNVVDPTVNGVSSGLSSCTIAITGPASASSSCTAGDNTFRLDAALFGSVPPDDGTYTVSVSATDNVGNSSISLFQVILDNAPPDNYVENLGAPNYTSGGITYVKSTTPIDVTGDDGTGSGIAGCTLEIDGGGATSYTLGTNFTLPPPDGAHTYEIVCTDNLGNTSAPFSRTRIVDDTPPTITKDIPGAPTYLGGAPAGTECEGDPGTRCYVSSITLLRITVVEPPAGAWPGSGFANCTIQAVGQHFGDTYDPGCTEGNNDFTLPFSLRDDLYRVTVTAQDHLGNVSSGVPLEVILDNTPPTITTPIHTNSTCYPLDRCDVLPEAVLDGTWVKAQDKYPFTPEDPLLPSYPQFIPRSTFEYPEAGSAVDPTPIEDPDVASGVPGSGLLDCTLSGGTTADGVYTPGFGAIDFSFLPGDGARTFRLECRDNLSYSIPVNTSFDQRTLNVDDTPPQATFVTAGPRYDDPTDGTIFIESNTLITPVLVDAGVGVDLDGVGGPPADIGPTNPPCLQNQDQNAALLQRCTTPFTFPPPDRDHHLWIIRPDLLGNVAESHFVFIVDDTPPQVEIRTPLEQAQYVLNAEVLADWSVTDDISFFEGPQEPPFAPGLVPRGSGIREIIVTTPKGEPIDTWGVGVKVFTLIATDNLGHQTVAQITYHVVYAFAIDPALEAALAEGRYTAGSEVPLSFWLGDAHGVEVTDARPQIRLFTAQGEEILLDPGGKPVFAHYDPELNRYVYVLDTGRLGLRPGSYEVWIQPGDATTHKLKLTLR